MTRSLIARVRAHSLDRRLAVGEDPLDDPLLAERAAQVGHRAARQQLAGRLERVIVDAAEPRRFSAAVPVCRREVLRALPTLLRLIRRLRDGLPAWPGGIAAVRDLLADGAGPLYVERRRGTLQRRARIALRRLDDGLAAP